jgi:Tol biopolymer transport system component
MLIRLLAAATLAAPPVLSAQQPARPIINGGLPSVSPTGDAIAFLSNRSGTYDLYITSPDGAELLRITNTPANESAPYWTKDARVVFSTMQEGATMAETMAINKSTVYSVSSSAPQPVIIGTVAGRQPTISPDGKKLVYSSGQYPSMHIVESALDGSNVRQLSKTPSPQFNAVYSPDQTQIAFARSDSTRQLQVWVMNADGTGERQLTRFSADEGSPQWPAWSPDGSRLAIQSGKYNRNAPAENTAHIWVIDVKTGAATRLNAHTTPYLDETPSWFPDGKRIAFQSDRSGRMEVWVMNSDGSGARQVTK